MRGMFIAALKKMKLMLFGRSSLKQARHHYFAKSEMYRRQQQFQSLSRFGQSPIRMMKY